MNFLLTENKGDYTIITLNRGKASPLSHDMVNEFRGLLKELTADDSVKGIILTGQEHFFSVGVDVKEMYEKDREGVTGFWRDFSSLIAELFAFPKPFITAITGHSPAGGTVMAICSDYRVMAQGKYQIGLNEMAVGITLPQMIFEIYAFWIGKGKAYQYLLEAKMMLPDQALQVGLVDEVCDGSEVLARAEAKMKQYLSYSEASWVHSKKNMRKEQLDKNENIVFERDYVDTMEDWWLPENREALSRVVAMLK